ncbi:MAG: hypothetical protein FJ118_08195 [Deltaproteobacteria bacterium]|nr:hypothetical protein [Deltaproteobacteria bacterium]
MAQKRLFKNPFRVFSPDVKEEVLRLKGLHQRRVSASTALHEGLLIMLSKLVEMGNILTTALEFGESTSLAECARLAAELLEEERILTNYLVSAGVSADEMKGLIRFPYRLKRVGDGLLSIENCLRIKSAERISFGEKADGELKELFSALKGMMISLREAFIEPAEGLLEEVINRNKLLAELIEHSKIKHWIRLEKGESPVEASSMFRDILDSLRMANEYLEKMARALLEMGAGSQGG